jgi:hypothetical protein
MGVRNWDAFWSGDDSGDGKSGALRDSVALKWASCGSHSHASSISDGSDRADRGAGADVHYPDFAIGLGEVGFLTLDDGTGEGATDGADCGSVYGVDDTDGTAFEFDCVGHVTIIPGGKVTCQMGNERYVII